MFWNGSTAIDGLSGSCSGFLASFGRCRCRRFFLPRWTYRIYANGPRDILDLLFAAILESGLDLAVDFAVDFPRYQDASGIAESFQSRGYIDAFPIDIAALLYEDIAEIEADPHP